MIYISNGDYTAEKATGIHAWLASSEYLSQIKEKHKELIVAGIKLWT